MNTYFGNYLGLCISNSDPEQRGRVQVLIPHIMPALYKNWNETEEDKFITCLGDNLPDALTTEQVERLRKILPWAEGAMPILGPCAPGRLLGSNYDLSPTAGSSGAILSDEALAALPAANRDAIFSFANVPTDTQRRLKWESGGAIVNLDTNWFGNEKTNQPIYDVQTAPLVVVPDNATPLQIELANTYAKKVEEAYREKFNTSLPSAGAVKRSVNGRGRANTIHTEPFAVTDTKAVEYFTRDPVGRQKLAEITYTTLGRIPNVQFALPHGGINGSPGATGRLGSEVNNASILLKDLYGLLGRSAPQTSGLFAGGSSTDRLVNRFAGEQDGYPGWAPNRETTPHEQLPLDLAGGASGDPIGGAVTTSRGTTGQSTISTAGMSPSFKAQYDRVLASLGGTQFDVDKMSTPPKDGAKYGVPTGSREEWAHFFTRLAFVESDFDAGVAATKEGKRVSRNSDSAVSFGVYQMGKDQFKTFNAINGSIFNADSNTQAFVRYAESLYFGTGNNDYSKYGGRNLIAFEDKSLPRGFGGIAAGYGPLQRSIDLNWGTNKKEPLLLGENISTAEALSIGDDVQLVQTGNPHFGNGNAPPGGRDVNDVVGGALGVPNPGAVLWCFFREGNPMFPVYFAASYGEKEWSSAYGHKGSQVPGSTHPTEDNAADSSGWNMNLAGGAGIYAQKDFNPDDPEQNRAQLMLYGEDGSHVWLGGKGYNEILSRGDHADIVEKNRFETVRMNKETWVNGVNNMVIRGDNIKIVGNVCKEAIDAVEAIQKRIAESYAPLINSGG